MPNSLTLPENILKGANIRRIHLARSTTNTRRYTDSGSVRNNVGRGCNYS